MQAIFTEKLTKSYGNSRGIIALDLQVEEGQFYGFIGPNGAGKSTTIRTLLGLITPTSGSARVLGMDVVKQRTQLLSRVGYLPSEAMFYRGMRGKEILDFGDLGQGVSVESAGLSSDLSALQVSDGLCAGNVGSGRGITTTSHQGQHHDCGQYDCD